MWCGCVCWVCVCWLVLSFLLCGGRMFLCIVFVVFWSVGVCVFIGFRDFIVWSMIGWWWVIWVCCWLGWWVVGMYICVLLVFGWVGWVVDCSGSCVVGVGVLMWMIVCGCLNWWLRFCILMIVFVGCCVLGCFWLRILWWLSWDSCGCCVLWVFVMWWSCYWSCCRLVVNRFGGVCCVFCCMCCVWCFVFVCCWVLWGVGWVVVDVWWVSVVCWVLYISLGKGFLDVFVLCLWWLFGMYFGLDGWMWDCVIVFVIVFVCLLLIGGFVVGFMWCCERGCFFVVVVCVGLGFIGWGLLLWGILGLIVVVLVNRNWIIMVCGVNGMVVILLVGLVVVLSVWKVDWLIW